MKKRSSIMRFSIVGFFLIIGVILCFCTMSFGNTNLKSFATTIKLGLDLKGGVFAVYEAETGGSTEELSQRMDGTQLRLQNLLVSKGYSEATVVRQGSNRLRVEVPDVDDPGKIFDLIGKPAELKFVDENNHEVLTGNNVTLARAGYDAESGGYAVYLNLDAEGSRKFAEATATENHGKTISIITKVGDEEQTISSPTINSTITNGRAVIIGMGTAENAQALADQIASGQFEVRLKLLDSDSVPPTLGADALKFGLIAGIIAVLIVMAFMCVFYRMYGALASFALLAYIVLMLFFLAALPWVQLTLPGIAGILLSIGMAVDGNVIMFERIKNDYRNGKSIKAASYSGMKQGFWPIFDGNLTTIIAAVVLLIFGTGPIQSFAITLLVGVVLAMFTNLVIMNFFVKWMLGINMTSEKLYGLRRGTGYESLGADKTDVTILEAETEIETQRIREKELKDAARKGGINHEQV